jgi:4-amino-4-deoxy-L-arabinose transferase-like glycosyltransferase
MSGRTRAPTFLALSLSLAAIGITAYLSSHIFERMPHLEDEFANLWEAQVMAGGGFWQPSPEPARAYLVPFVVDHEGQRFGKYPPGWPAALSLGARAGAAWLVNPLLAGAAIWLTYRLGSKVVGGWLGLLASLLLLSSPMFLMLSSSLMSHTFSLVLGLAFTLSWFELFLEQAGSGGNRRRGEAVLIALSGLSLGLQILTRPWTAVALAAPFIVHGVILWFRSNAQLRRQLASIAILTGLLAACIPLWQYAVTGDAWLNPYTLWWSYDRLGFGPGIGHTDSGHNLFWAVYNTRFSLSAGLHDLFGWPYLSWLLLPFGLLALRSKPGGRLLAGIPLALILFYGAYWIGSWLFGPRYYAESLPMLSIISAAGAAWLAGSAWSNQPMRRWGGPLVGGLVLLLVSINALWYLPARLGGMQGLYNITRAPSEELASQELGHALVLVHAERWFQYANLLVLVPPFAESDLLIAWSTNARVEAELVASAGDRSIYIYDAVQGELKPLVKVP